MARRAKVSEATVVTRLLLRAIAASEDGGDPVVAKIASLHPAWPGNPIPARPAKSKAAPAARAKGSKKTASAGASTAEGSDGA